MDDERTLYSYNKGDALVTSRRLVLGKESWPLDQVAEVALVPHNDWFADYLSKGSQRGDSKMWRGMAWALVGMLLFGLALFLEPVGEDLSLIWFLLYGVPATMGMVLFLTGVFTAFRAFLKHPPQVYGVRIVLKSDTGEVVTSEARYRFDYKPPAERTILAVRDAIGSDKSLQGQHV